MQELSCLRKFEEISDVFSQYFPDAIFSETQLEVLPKPALKQFEGYSARFIPRSEYKKGNFIGLYKISFQDKSSCFVATQNKIDDSIYVIDLNKEGVKTGHGEVIIRTNHKFENISDPCGLIAYIDTEPDFSRKGLGERRLRVMHALSKSLYDAPLYIQGIIEGSGSSFFKKMNQKGLIEFYKMNMGRPQYLFE